VTIAVVLVALNGAYNAVLGILLMLSRYDVPASDVLATSLVGAGVILFGLLTLAIASGIARGSRLSRLLLTVYLAVQFALHAYTIVVSDAWDVTSIVQIVIEAAIVAVVWAPPGGRHFASRTPAPDPFAP
jgi:holin-like protein